MLWFELPAELNRRSTDQGSVVLPDFVCFAVLGVGCLSAAKRILSWFASLVVGIFVLTP